MVGRFTSVGIAIQVALDAVVGCAADAYATALHQEELPAVDAVAGGRGHVDSCVLQRDILAGLDTVLGIADDIECTLLGKLGVALDIETALLRTANGIGQCIGGASHNFHLDALAVLDMHGSPAIHGCRVGQRQAVQFYRSLVGARHVELAIGRGTAQRIGNLVG